MTIGQIKLILVAKFSVSVDIQGGAKRMDSPIFKSGDYNFNLIASI